jgi:hypothetical protein
MPISKPVAKVFTDPQVYPTLDGEVHINTGTFTEASSVSIGGITQPLDAELPDEGVPFNFVLGRDEGAGEPEGDGLRTRFTPTAEEVGRDGKNVVRIEGYGLERKLRQNTVTRNFDGASPGAVVRHACDVASVPRLNAAYPDPSATDFDVGVIIRKARQDDEVAITTDYGDVPCINVVDQACRSIGWDWRIVDGILWYGSPGAARNVPPEARIPDIERGGEDIEEAFAVNTAPTTYDLRWILSDGTSPYLQERPFDLIRVIGAPVVITSSGVSQPISDPTIAEIPTGPPGPDGGSGGTADGSAAPRVHVFSSDRVKSQQQANQVARTLYREIERRAAHGTVSVVGDPRPLPLDRVNMPESVGGGGNYGVKSVYHRITSEGFVSEISVQGALPDEMPEVRTEPTYDAIEVSDNQSTSPETNA